jgi:thioredoxin reductase
MLDVLIIGAGLSGIGAARTVDWSERESVRAKLRLMVKRILKKYKYPPPIKLRLLWSWS